MPRTEVKTVSKEFFFPLTEADYAEKARRIGEARSSLASAQRKFSIAKQEFKDIEKECNAEISHEIRVIQAKKELRDVECEEVRDFEKGLIFWRYKGEVMGQRVMEMDERQPMLIPEPGAVSSDEDKWNQLGGVVRG